MKVAFSPIAEETLENTSEFIDEMNIAGAGERWVERFVNHIYKYARLENVQWPVCHNQDLAEAGMNCLVYKGWVVVFRIEKNIFVVYQIIHGALLK